MIDRALEVLHEQDEWLIANRQAIDTKIHRGLEELERGFLKTNLTRIFNGLKVQPE